MKKLIVHHENSTQSTTSPMKFVSAATMAVSMNTNNNAIPEISDEELLEMALMFEKEQQK